MSVENNDVFQIKINEGKQCEFLTHPQKTTLYRFLGNLAMYDCLRTELKDNQGSYIAWTFLVSDDERGANELTDCLLKNGYECILDAETVPSEVTSAYEELIHSQAAGVNYIPSDWA